MKNSSNGKWLRQRDNRNFVYLILIVVSLWLLAWKLIVWLIPPDEGGMGRGVFGDMFGSINSLFSGLALAGIIYTVYLQKKELKLQRNELKLTRNEFKIQNDTLKTQKFENSFFSLVKNHQVLMDILPSHKLGSKGEVKVRYAALKEIKDEFETSFDNMRRVIKKKSISGIYYAQYGSFQKLCSKIVEYVPLAKDTLLTLEFIEKSNIQDRDMYYKILKNSMSLSESILFGFYIEFFNSEIKISPEIKEKFQSDYFNNIKEAIGRKTILPPLLLPFRFYTEERYTTNQHPGNYVTKDNLMEWAKIVTFGFKNLDNQDISVIGLEVLNERGVIVDIELNHKLVTKEEFTFLPLIYENLDIEKLARSEILKLDFIMLLKIDCSVSGKYVVQYDLNLREGHEKSKIQFSEFVENYDWSRQFQYTSGE